MPAMPCNKGKIYFASSIAKKVMLHAATSRAGVEMNHICPCCGYPGLDEAAYYQDNPDASGSLEICPCCGFQFGYTDHALDVSFKQWRDRWLSLGAPWKSQGRPQPESWDLRRQLLNIGVTI